ncbi:MAG: DAK2 domain-containing protein [Propioniciclava sp.]
MDASALKARIRAALDLLIDSADELRDLDQALGDGDLGITVSAGSRAVIDALDGLADDAAPTEVLRVSAKAFANANPSTMAALVAGALLAGAKTWADISDITVLDAHRFVAAAADSIAVRGKTQPGDKTILDGLIAVRDVLADADADGAVDASVAAAADALERTTALQSRRGRAAWLQERSVGQPDPGSTALLRFIEAWQTVGERP